MLKLLKHLKSREWVMVGLSAVFMIAQVWLELKIPDYMSRVTELVQTPGSAMGDVWLEGGKMLLCALGSVATSVIIGCFAAKVASRFTHRLRAEIFDKVEAFSMEEINGFSTDSLITRSTNDITQIQMLVAMGLQVMIKAPVMAVWAVLKIAGKSWQWSALTGGAVLFLALMILFLMLYALPRFKRIQGLTDNLNRVTRENLTGIRVVRAYNAEGYQEAKFEQTNSELTRTTLEAHQAMNVMNPGMRIIMNGLTLGIYWIGAYLIDTAAGPDKIPLFSDMVVFTSYAMQVVMSFMMLMMIFIMLPRALVSARRIREVLDTSPKILDGTRTDSPEGRTGEVEFRGVSFKYPDAEEYVLENISFKAKKGETVAFIGSTGSGKSTLVNLVPRFYDAAEGQVLVDGVDVREYTQEALHNKLGYVSQKAVMFSGTVSSNVAYGSSGRERPDEEDIRSAVRIAQGSDFVEKMEDGYQSAIAQGGTNVSGGQKQRLSIARAVCRKPEIYIFDDSFSALDYKTDRSLRAALKRETAGVTSLIVAQRIGTIKDADQIIVLDEGRMVGSGKHEELMESCEVYREIAYSQLSKEELGA